jgi:hypothetical protein
MNREVHVRFCEGVGVKFPRATRPLIHTFGFATRPLIHTLLEFNLAQYVESQSTLLRFGQRTPTNRTHFLSWPNH